MPDKLDEFTQAYLVAALWSSNDQSDEQGGDPLDENYDIKDIDPVALEKAKADCAKFQQEFGHLITEENCLKFEDSPLSQAGHDFWMTRNGHGVGFWEESDWEKEAGKILTNGSKKFGELNLYVNDGLICGFGE